MIRCRLSSTTAADAAVGRALVPRFDLGDSGDLARSRNRSAFLGLALAGFLAAGLYGCGGSAGANPNPVVGSTSVPSDTVPLQLKPAEPFFLPGEAMSFEMSYQGVLGGRSAVAVGQPGLVDGRKAVIVRSVFETDGLAKMVKAVRDDFHSRIDATTGAPIEHDVDYHSGENHLVSKARFEGDQAVIEYVRNDKPKKTRRIRVPEGEIVHDAHSILGALRAWQPNEPGDAVYFYSVSGRRVWRSEIRFMGSETVRTALGLRAALRYEGTTRRLTYDLQIDEKKPERGVSIWIGDDAFRAPLRFVARIEYGELQAELVDYQRPEPRVSRN